MPILKNIAVLAVLAFVGCSTAGETPRAPDHRASTGAPSLNTFLTEQGYESLPLRRLATGHFAVDGTADAVILTLIIDTGASHTVLDRRRAERFGLTVTEESGRAIGLGTSDGQVASAVLRNISIGALQLDSIRVTVLDLAHVNHVLREMRSGQVDGILGADMLLRKEAVIDYSESRLYIRNK